MNKSYVDFHCHLDLYPNFAAAVKAAEEAEIYTLTVTTTPRAWPRNLELTHKARFVRAALGLHPQLVHERSDEIALWEQYLPETRYVGEVGIDAGPKYYRSVALQKQIFEHVLKTCARAGGKTLTVHSVRSATLVLDLVEANLPRHRGQVVLHWFSGSKSEARRAIELGCYFSVNAQMLISERARETVSILPKNRLLTETDGPFTNVGDRPATPRDVNLAIEGLAQVLKLSTQQTAHLIRQNLKELLRTD